jgi:hypothetical protein
MKADTAFGGVGLKIGGDIAELERHGFLSSCKPRALPIVY